MKLRQIKFKVVKTCTLPGVIASFRSVESYAIGSLYRIVRAKYAERHDHSHHHIIISFSQKERLTTFLSSKIFFYLSLSLSVIFYLGLALIARYFTLFCVQLFYRIKIGCSESERVSDTM